MYLPFLHLFQLPLPPEQPLAPNGQSGSRHTDSRNLATLSPYRDAPNMPGVSVNLPDDCTVDQVILVSSLPHNELVLWMTSVPTASYTDTDPVVPCLSKSSFSDSDRKSVV